MSRFVFIAVFAALTLTAAEDPPNFSGTWKMDTSRSESAHQSAPLGPVVLIIRQTANDISIETRTNERDKAAIANETLTFQLDGSEKSVSGSSGIPVKTKAHWDGASLVTETGRNVQDSTVTTHYVLSMDPGGKELTVDKTLTVQHGYQFPGANNTGKSKDVFIRKADARK